MSDARYNPVLNIAQGIERVRPWPASQLCQYIQDKCKVQSTSPRVVEDHESQDQSGSVNATESNISSLRTAVNAHRQLLSNRLGRSSESVVNCELLSLDHSHSLWYQSNTPCSSQESYHNYTRGYSCKANTSDAIRNWCRKRPDLPFVGKTIDLSSVLDYRYALAT